MCVCVCGCWGLCLGEECKACLNMRPGVCCLLPFSLCSPPPPPPRSPLPPYLYLCVDPGDVSVRLPWAISIVPSSLSDWELFVTCGRLFGWMMKSDTRTKKLSETVSLPLCRLYLSVLLLHRGGSPLSVLQHFRCLTSGSGRQSFLSNKKPWEDLNDWNHKLNQTFSNKSVKYHTCVKIREIYYVSAITCLQFQPINVFLERWKPKNNVHCVYTGFELLPCGWSGWLILLILFSHSAIKY